MQDDLSHVNLQGVLFSLGCAACVGMHMVLSKLVLTTISPFTSLFFMALCSVTFSSIPFLSKGSLPTIPSEVPRKAIIQVFLHSLLATGGMAFTWSGLKYLNPTVVSFVGRFEVVVSVCTAVWFLGERFNKFKVFGFLLGIFGVLVLSFPGEGQFATFFTDKSQAGIVLVLLGASCYGSCEIFSVKAVKYMNINHFVFMRSFFNFCFLSLLAVVTGSLVPIPWEAFSILFVAAFLGPYFGRHLFMASVKRIPLAISVGLNQTQPFFAAMLSSFFVMGLPTSQQWFGGALILCGCLFLVGSRGRQKRQELRKAMREIQEP